MKYHVGDKVKVREDLEIGVYYGDVRFTITMGKFKGKTVTISAAHEDAHSLYLVNEDEEFCKWTDETLEDEFKFVYDDCVFKYDKKRKKITDRNNCSIGSSYRLEMCLKDEIELIEKEKNV